MITKSNCCETKRWIYALVFLTAWISITLLSLKNIPTYDMYYMARLGKELLSNNLKLCFNNPMSIVDGAKVVVQQPFFCILSYIMLDQLPFIYEAYIGGFLLLQGVLLLKVGKEYGFSKDLNITLSILGMIIISFYAGFRPFMVDLVLFLGEIICIKKYQKQSNIKWLIYLPICSFFIANTHASMALYSFIFVLPFLLPEGIKKKSLVKWKQEIFTKFFFFVCMILASLITPLMPFSVVWILKYVNVSDFSIYISELHPIYKNAPIWDIFLFACMSILSVCLIYQILRYKCEYLQEVALLLGLSLMGFMFIRNFSFAILGIFAAISTLIKGISRDYSKKERILCLIALGLIVCSAYKTPDQKGFDCQIPKEIANYLLLQGGKQYILAQPDASSYLNYYANCHTAINSMPESGFKKMNGVCDVFKDTWLLYQDFSMDYFSKYHIDYAIFCQNPDCVFYYDEKPIREGLLKNGWVSVMEDGDCVLFKNPYK